MIRVKQWVNHMVLWWQYVWRSNFNISSVQLLMLESIDAFVCFPVLDQAAEIRILWYWKTKSILFHVTYLYVYQLPLMWKLWAITVVCGPIIQGDNVSSAIMGPYNLWSNHRFFDIFFRYLLAVFPASLWLWNASCEVSADSSWKPEAEVSRSTRRRPRLEIHQRC